jgi:hypothetical protein
MMAETVTWNPAMAGMHIGVREYFPHRGAGSFNGQKAFINHCEGVAPVQFSNSLIDFAMLVSQ